MCALLSGGLSSKKIFWQWERQTEHTMTSTFQCRGKEKWKLIHSCFHSGETLVLSASRDNKLLTRRRKKNDRELRFRESASTSRVSCLSFGVIASESIKLSSFQMVLNKKKGNQEGTEGLQQWNWNYSLTNSVFVVPIKVNMFHYQPSDLNITVNIFFLLVFKQQQNQGCNGISTTESWSLVCWCLGVASSLPPTITWQKQEVKNRSQAKGKKNRGESGDDSEWPCCQIFSWKTGWTNGHP